MMFSLLFKTTKTRTWDRIGVRIRMTPLKVFIGCCLVLWCVYLTISLPMDSPENQVTKEDAKENFHQFDLKGQWILIPRSNPLSVINTYSGDNNTSIKRPKRSICHTFIGRLGNKIFQYAAIYSLARRNGLNMVMSSSFNLTDVFSNLAESSLKFRPCLYYTKLFEQDPYRFESAINLLPNNTDYLVEGFLQSWKYFQPYEADIRRQFTFNKHIEYEAEYRLNLALQEFRKKRNLKHPIGSLVGVHVRRGDYAKLLRGGSVGINLPTSGYFQRAKDYFRSRYPAPVFVVCSDDIEWCERNIGNDDAVFIRHNPPEVDLAILAGLNHTITSFGTFTFWAAWLANGTTVYPKNIVDEHFGSRKDIYLSDHIYPTWIPL